MKKILALFLTFSLLFSLTACRREKPVTPSGKEDGTLHYTYCDYINDSTVVVKLQAPDECLYYRDLLKKNGEEDIYDAIVYTATHLADPVEEYPNVSAVYFRRDVTEDELIRAFGYAYLSHPEIWFFRTAAHNGCSLDGTNPRCAYLTYSENIDAIPEYNEKVLYCANSILEKTADGLHDETEIASALTGWMCANCSMSDEDFATRTSVSMREVITEKKGTCLANSFALTYFLQRCGIAAFVGAGSINTLSYLSHFWTISVSDDRYLYTDVYYMGQVYNHSEENTQNYLLTDDPALFLDKRMVKPCEDMPLIGSKVGSGEIAHGIVIGRETLPPTKEA